MNTRHGQDVRVFRTIEAAYEWRNTIAAEWWGAEMPKDVPAPADPDALGARYFDWQSDHGEEWFSTHDCELIDR